MNKNEELEYLMNPTLYDKYLHLSSKERNTVFLEEKKFYRKRIHQMAKECSKFGIVKGVEAPPPSLLKGFDNFTKLCIDHFKMIDEAECYQKEYDGMEEEEKNLEHGEIVDIQQLNTQLLGTHTAEKKVISMDDFVTKKTTKPKKPLHLPKQRVANVKDEKYRTKGIKKNKSNDIIGNEK
jgi:hypothetical protein